MASRQQIILGYLLSGLSNREIAGAMGYALQTIKNEIHDIYCHLGIRNSRGLFPIIERAREQAVMPVKAEAVGA